MPDVDPPPVAEDSLGPAFDRRTLLVGAAGAVVFAGSPRVRRPRGVDPALARALQHPLRDALSDPSTNFPGGILHLHSPRLGAWTGAAGLGRLAPATRMRPGGPFPAGAPANPVAATL